MTVGVGGDVAYSATPERPRAETGWHARFIVAFGGAVLVVVAMMFASAWTTGLRPSTFEDLRSDLSDGAVRQWYAAERLEEAPLDLTRAPSSGIRGELEQPMDGEFFPPMGDSLGGIIVWRTWGQSGWQVASSSGVTFSGDAHSEAATEESAALVGQLRTAGVAMRPYEFTDGPFDWVYAVGAMLLLGGLIMGAAPRVGTRWFWFWMIINAPLALGAVGYAVTELIGFRRRPDPPLKRRLTGLMGFVLAIISGIVVGVVTDWLRDRGLPIPF